MIAYLRLLLPILATAVALVLGLVLLIKQRKSLLQKTILFSTPWVILLQIGTFMLVSNNLQNFKLVGGRIALFSLCLLAPICTKLSLLWGKSNGEQVLKKFKAILVLQWIISLGFVVFIPLSQFHFITRDAASESVLVFGKLGQYFLIYLIVSSVLILSIFENKIRILRHVKEIRIPTILFMGIFIFFIIEASQGLLIRTLNSSLLLFISLSVFLGYLTPILYRFKSFMTYDKIPENRETVYSSFMVLLVGGYLVLIGLIGKLMAAVGGDVQIFFSVIVASAVVFIFFMILTSFSLKERIRKFIDRTIYKGQYDYRTIWSRFSDKISFKINLDDLNDSILDTVTDFLEVKSGAILLAQSNSSKLHIVKKNLEGVDEVNLSSRHAFIDWLWRLGEPVKLFGISVTKSLPDSFNDVKEQFEKLQASVCVPLSTKAGLIGILVLGEKKGKDYSQEDFKILETLANHSALAIQNLRLQEHLRETKELESFYKLSSFVLHDLRNTVSMLSMLSENARVSIDEPEFRHSLIKTLSGSVDKMKGLLLKISMASNHIQTSLQEIDLIELIKESLVDIKFNSNIDLKLQLEEVPKVLADTVQLKKVMVNLVLNAIEAMPNGGQLTIKASQGKLSDVPQSIAADWMPKVFVAVAVSDSGCGMTEEFMDSKLFKPFQTTKKSGLGIGLYHCKEIIETVGGRIWAESRLGSGSTFYIALPVKRLEEKKEEYKLDSELVQSI